MSDFDGWEQIAAGTWRLPLPEGGWLYRIFNSAVCYVPPLATTTTAEAERSPEFLQHWDSRDGEQRLTRWERGPLLMRRVMWYVYERGCAPEYIDEVVAAQWLKRNDYAFPEQSSL